MYLTRLFWRDLCIIVHFESHTIAGITTRCRCTFRYISNFTTTSWLLVKKRKHGRIQGAAQIFWLRAIISGTGKAAHFKFCTHILSINRNKSPLQISGKVAVGVVKTRQIFQSTHILGASHGRLCDSSAFLLFLATSFIGLHYAADNIDLSSLKFLWRVL